MEWESDLDLDTVGGKLKNFGIKKISSYLQKKGKIKIDDYWRCIVCTQVNLKAAQSCTVCEAAKPHLDLEAIFATLLKVDSAAVLRKDFGNILKARAFLSDLGWPLKSVGNLASNEMYVLEMRLSLVT